MTRSRRSSCPEIRFAFATHLGRNLGVLTVGTALSLGLAGSSALAQEAETYRGPVRLNRVEILETHRATAIQLHLDGPLPEASTSTLDNPPRLIVRLPGVIDRTDSPVIEVGNPRAERVLIQQRKGGLDIIIEAGEAPDPFQDRGISPTDAGLLVTIGMAPEGAPTAADGTAAGPGPTRADGAAFLVERFVLEYGEVAAGQPPLDDVLRLQVELGRTYKGWVAPREGIPTQSVQLDGVPRLAQKRFYASALKTILDHIVEQFQGYGLASILVQAHEEDVDLRSGRDLRTGAGGPLRLVVWTGRLLEFRTFASGQRFNDLSPEERTDNTAHARILERSPLQAGDLFFKNELDDYAARLSRHPGRSVDWTVSESPSQLGGLYLDYLVAEARPVRAYVQASNTGTPETTEWRQRFGFMHSQLTNHDDILRIDYITGNFQEVNAVLASYDMPLYRLNRWRGNIGGSWSEYDASELGSPANFQGTQWDAGGQILANAFQHDDFFLDLLVGARYQHVETTREIIPGFPDPPGNTNFFLPEFGIRAERYVPEMTLRGIVSGEWNVSSVAGTDAADFDALGRLGVTEEDFKILHWNALWSFFLEPLIVPSGYADPSTSLSSALAHEIQLVTFGQYTPDRLAAQFQQIVGGLRTVRGYDQALVAGDTVIVGRAEYRFHLPRVFPMRPVPYELPVVGEFRFARQQPTGMPDWDLIIRPFVDVGQVLINDKLTGEQDETLLGAGVGIELRVRDFLTVGFDWGRGLRTVREGLPGEVQAGGDEFYFSGSLVY